MNDMLHSLANHGYWLVFACLLGGQAGLPVPGNLILLSAGALAASGKLKLRSYRVSFGPRPGAGRSGVV